MFVLFPTLPDVVHLHLREVGVVGGVERHARADAVLQIDPDVAGPGGLRRLGAVGRVPERIGHELQVALRRHAESLELARQREAVQGVLPRQRRPVGLLVAEADVALEVHPPGLHVGRWIAQRAERDRNLRRPADVGDAGGHLPHAVPVHVQPAARPALLPAVARTPAPAAAEPAAALPLVGQLPVVLDPGRVGPEDETVQAVVVGVEDDPEAVGLGQIGVAPAVGRDDRRRVVRVADDAEEQRVLGMDDAHLGPLRGGLPIERTVLHEAGRHPGVLVGRVGQHVAVDQRRFPDAQRQGDRGPCRGQLAGLECGECSRVGLGRLTVAGTVAVGRLSDHPHGQSGGQNHEGDGTPDATDQRIHHVLRAFNETSILAVFDGCRDRTVYVCPFAALSGGPIRTSPASTRRVASPLTRRPCSCYFRLRE